MMWYGDGMDGWGGAFLIVMGVLVLVPVIAATAVLIRHLGRGSPLDGDVQSRPPTEQLLHERFARGEIDAEEYRRRLDTLRSEVLPRFEPTRTGSQKRSFASRAWPAACRR